VKNITGLRQGKGLSRSIFSVLAIAALVSGFFVATNFAQAETVDIGPTDSIQVAIDAATDGDTINLSEGTYELLVQLNITKPLTITGVGVVILKAVNPSWSTENGSKHLLGIYAGTEVAPVTISNIVIDADSKSHAVNTYGNAYGILNDVTIQNGKGAGLTVNGSTIIATNLNTSGNAWGAVNVDPGSGVLTPSVFTLTGGNLTEDNQIWSDGTNVGEIATVIVNAEGYSEYKKAGTTAFFVWANDALTNVATILSDPATFYTSIQAAINAAASDDTINVAAGTYNEALNINKSLTLNGAKAGSDARTRDTSSGESTLDGTGLPTSQHDAIMIADGVSNVTIDGFEIRNYAGSGGNGDGNAISSYCESPSTTGANNITIKNNYTHDLSYNGILVGSENIVGESMVVQSGWTIQHNKIAGYRYAGIELTNVTNSQVKDNDIAAPISLFVDPGDAGVGIEIAARSRTKPVTAGTNVEVSGNTITGTFPTGSRAAINLLSRTYAATSNAILSGVTVSGNNISGATNVRAAILAVAESRLNGPATISTLAITDNILDGNLAAIEIQDFVKTGTGTATHSAITVTGNELKNSTGVGLHLMTDTLATEITVNSNKIHTNALFGINNEGTSILDATNNWWGTASGPADSAVTDNVDYTPWCENEACSSTRNFNVFIDSNTNSVHDEGELTFNSIQLAITAASASATINVMAGTYDIASTMILNKALTIFGPVSGVAKVQGTDPNVISIFEITASDVTIQNLEITHNALPAFVSAGWAELPNSLIRIPVSLGLSGVTITNNKIYVPVQLGIMSTWNGVVITVGANTTTGISITGNTIHNTRNGVVVQYGNTATVSNNIIYDTKGGIMNYTSSQADANNRTVSGNSWGTTHNEWDIVWNTAYYVPDYQVSVLELSGTNNNAYVLDRRATDAVACAALTGNRSHIFVDDDSTVVTAHPARGNFNEPFATLALGINAVVQGGIVNVAAGTYEPFKVISKDLTITGTGNPVIRGALDVSADITLPRFNGKVTKTVVLIKDSTVDINGLNIEGDALVDSGTGNSGFALIYENSNGVVNHIIASPNDTTSQTPNITILGTFGIGIWKYNHTDTMDVTVQNSTIENFGSMGITVWNGAKAQIENNTIIGQVYNEAGKEIYGINVDDTFYTSEEHEVTDVAITGNEIYNCDNTVSPADARDQAAALHLNASLEYDNGGLVTLESKITITNNIFRDNRIGIYVVHGSPVNTYASDNSIYNSRLYGVASKLNVSGESVEFNATSNWWGSVSPDFVTIISGSASYDPWYVNSERTILSDVVSGGDTVIGTDSNVSLGSEGEASLPSGIINLILSNDSNLDLFDGLVDDAVTLNSGTPGEPVVLTNSDLEDVTVSIPDETLITGPVGWDGIITPPTSETPSGTAPAGFSVGDTVINIGSPDGTLVFDNPVTILLEGVTGTVGYRPSGSDTWYTITTCGGTYDAPILPTAPGECAKDNGTDTKIVTYHFTSFGSLTANPTPAPSSGGGGGSYYYQTPTPTPKILGASIKKGDSNNDGRVDSLDFNALMVNWGSTGGNPSDSNGDGKVDVLDFNLLMINWNS